MYRHPCILDCMHFVSYALVRKSFSYIHCSPWNAIYVFVSLFGMMWLVWLSSWKSWFISVVDGNVFEKWHMYALLWVNAFIWSWHVLVACLCLIRGWIAYLDHMGPKAHLPSWMFSPLALSYGGACVPFCRKDISCTKYESKNEVEIAWKICSHVICAKFNLLWLLNRCMMPTNEKSHVYK
jgi:hypothetical protein